MILIVFSKNYFGSVAQSVERRDDNSKVGGSNPPVSIH